MGGERTQALDPPTMPRLPVLPAAPLQKHVIWRGNSEGCLAQAEDKKKADRETSLKSLGEDA